MDAAARATEVGSAMEALDFETEPLSKVASARLERVGAPIGAVIPMLSEHGL
jgi:hypothetical protein